MIGGSDARLGTGIVYIGAPKYISFGCAAGMDPYLGLLLQAAGYFGKQRVYKLKGYQVAAFALYQQQQTRKRNPQR